MKHVYIENGFATKWNFQYLLGWCEINAQYYNIYFDWYLL